MVKKSLLLPKEELDKKIKELLRLQEKQNEIGTRINELKTILESQFRLPARQKEIIQGNRMYMEKIPVDNGRNDFDVEMLTPVLKGIKGGYARCIVLKPTVVTNELYDMVKEGKLKETTLDACRKSKWTYRTTYKRIESNTKETPDSPTKLSRNKSKEEPKKQIKLAK